ncbi:MAG: hypothetical protein KVP17_004737 [Porospora cf. gigantea B]|uniref:uncharacterized protein n=1 Tax=Porospora cf. gigantea B TaxID=2853592 RepID=UPI003571BCA2|nr:MAG: hypothetical protein KVP17_004737 [Porospora cf. gigantea B]
MTVVPEGSTVLPPIYPTTPTSPTAGPQTSATDMESSTTAGELHPDDDDNGSSVIGIAVGSAAGGTTLVAGAVTAYMKGLFTGRDNTDDDVVLDSPDYPCRESAHEVVTEMYS